MLTVLERCGGSWFAGQDGIVDLEPGVSITFLPNRVHAFRVVGDRPLVTFGIHTFGKRIVNYEPPPESAR